MSLRSHIILSLGSLALLLAIAGQTIERSPSLRAALQGTTADIGIEHTRPLSLTLEYAEKEGSAIMRVSHESDETISISFPAQWERGEVSGAPLSAFRSDASVFGSVRSHLPPRSGITFSIRSAPEHIVVHNPSQAPLKLNTVNVDLTNGAVRRDVFLVQEGEVKIW